MAYLSSLEARLWVTSATVATNNCKWIYQHQNRTEVQVPLTKLLNRKLMISIRFRSQQTKVVTSNSKICEIEIHFLSFSVSFLFTSPLSISQRKMCRSTICFYFKCCDQLFSLFILFVYSFSVWAVMDFKANWMRLLRTHKYLYWNNDSNGDERRERESRALYLIRASVIESHWKRAREKLKRTCFFFLSAAATTSCMWGFSVSYFKLSKHQTASNGRKQKHEKLIENSIFRRFICTVAIYQRVSGSNWNRSVTFNRKTDSIRIARAAIN